MSEVTLPSRSTSASTEEKLEKAENRTTRRLRDTVWRLLNDGWAFEVGSILSSMVCMSAIIVVLSRYHEQTVPSLPQGFSLNAIVSTLATISKAAMLVSVTSCISQLKWHWFGHRRRLRDMALFDEASRGPWGAFVFLCRFFNLRAEMVPSLASVGVVILIVALGVDPFIQQIILYRSRTIPGGTGTAAVALTSRAQMFDMRLQPGGSGNAADGPDFGMKAAIHRGLFHKKSLDDANLKCASGNCTFVPFDSLAMCSKCVNVTELTRLVYVDGPHTVGTERSYSFIYGLPGDYNMTVKAQYRIGGDASQPSESLEQGVSLVSNAGMPASMARSQLGISNAVLSHAMMQFPLIDKDVKEGYASQRPLAWQCALYFCINTYNVTVSNGKVQVDIVDSYHGDPLPSSPPAVESQNASAPNLIFIRPRSSTIKSHNSTFFVRGETITRLNEYMNHTLSGIRPARPSRAPDAAAPYGWTNDVMEVLNKTSNVAVLMDALATSMTSYIRESERRGESATDMWQRGTNYITETYVVVRWGWMALPLALVGASALLLLATMSRASRDLLPVWKFSALPAFFHGLEEEGHGAEGPLLRGVRMSTLTDMEDFSEQLEVRFVRNDGGWKMVILDDGRGVRLRSLAVGDNIPRI
jgi:hypothetical protein